MIKELFVFAALVAIISAYPASNDAIYQPIDELNLQPAAVQPQVVEVDELEPAETAWAARGYYKGGGGGGGWKQGGNGYYNGGGGYYRGGGGGGGNWRRGGYRYG